tara:strand:- start:3432 stop:3758 length:327 start_codon:yes stop_codon:yes gene_type:complete
MKLQSAFLSLALAGFALSAPALAQDDQFSFTVETVSLHSDAAARDSYDRLEAAVTAYCSQFVAVQQCEAEMMETTLEQLANDRLLRIHAEAKAFSDEPTLTAAAYDAS